MANIKPDCIRKPSNPVPRSFIPQGGQPYRVTDNDSWVSLAQKKGVDAWSLIRFNYPNLPSGMQTAALEVNWYLQEYVGCRMVTADGKNYCFSSSASPGIIYLPDAGCSQPPATAPTPTPVQVNYWRFWLTLPFMYKEMIKNSQSTKALEIKALNLAAPGAAIGGPPGLGIGIGIGAKAAALLMWKEMVKTKAPWDHKWQLAPMLNLGPDYHFPIDGDPDHEWYYDIWSNIHYGYVGMAAAFTEWELQKGAAMGGSAGANDPIDVETVHIGCQLWRMHGTGLTQSQLHQAILGAKNTLLQLQQTPDYRAIQCKGKNPNFVHLEPITNGQ